MTRRSSSRVRDGKADMNVQSRGAMSGLQDSRPWPTICKCRKRGSWWAKSTKKRPVDGYNALNERRRCPGFECSFLKYLKSESSTTNSSMWSR